MTSGDRDLLPEEDFSYRRMMAFGCVGLSFLGLAYLMLFGADTKLNDTIGWGLVGIVVVIGGGYLGLPSVGEWQRRRSYTQIRTASIASGRVDNPDA